MKKSQIIVDGILAAAVVVLFVLFFTGKQGCCKKQSSTMPVAEVQEGNLPIAYLNVDSLLEGYTFAQEAQEKLMSKQEDARLKLNTKGRTLESEMADFQRKYENNAFLSQERAQNEYSRLQRKQQELQELEQKLTNDILLENQELNMQLADSLMAFLKDYNADGRFQVILSNQGKDNVLMAADGMDITADVIAGMNARYGK
ncbi:MAG: OmpH family outer membrane protein [Paludibacteraceae bacterium]|nr:OmpH family outer membrane protein [Paludibacteraceae bacterium]